MSNYINYHLHSDCSLLDSCTNFNNYIQKAVELKQNAICFTEHGRPMKWVEKKMSCDKAGIKFLHGVECYLTETHNVKIRDNFHTILIAKNYDGVLELNQAISKSCQKDHLYYHNRLSFREFFQLSDNIIKISACLASPLNRLPVNHPDYKKLVHAYDYLEIQPHLHPDQVNYNIHLATLSEKYNIPLIAGTDTHSLNQYKAECRQILLEAKNKSYGDEDTFDLAYKSYDELVNVFALQNAIPSDLYISAIENTNVMAASVEPFELDMSLKYPVLYGSREEDQKMFYQAIDRKLEDKTRESVIPHEQIPAFETAIEEEKRVFHKIQMEGFMLSMSELISWCRENEIPIGPARGSVGGSRIAYITDIIDLNPETWHTVFSRFCNEDRTEVGDIDIDVTAEDRPKIFQYIINRFGIPKTARVPSFGTLQDMAVIDEIGRALSYRYKQKNDDTTNPYTLDRIADIKKQYKASPEVAKRSNPELFYYFDGLVGTKISQSVHPAGMVISPVTLADHYGVFEKDGDQCLMIDMDEIHEVGLVKYDFLILKNIGIINEVYKMLGQKYPRTHEINWDDQAVWKDMLKSPVGIFQMEGDYAHSLLKQYEPHSIFDMSLVTAAIRPSGSSYRDQLIAHKPYKNPSSVIDELLKDNNGYLIYQEDTIKFLQQICGLSGSEADNVRRAIGRKDYDRLQKALPQILEGYCEKSPQPRTIAEQEAKQFLQIIEDSAAYQFGYNHSIAYCLIGYLCAYLRYYHPAEFIVAYLRNAANEDDIRDGTALANEYHIKIVSPEFGVSRGNYFYNPEQKVIAKGISSIKFLNERVAEELYQLSKLKFDLFLELLDAIDVQTSTNSRQLNILIKLDFFRRYGTPPTLLRLLDVFHFFRASQKHEWKRSISKKSIHEPALEALIKSTSTDTNDDGKELKSYRILNMHELLRGCEEHIKSLNLPDYSMKMKMAIQEELLGYVDLTTWQEADRTKLLVTDVRALRDTKNNEIWGYALFTRSVGSGKNGRMTVYTRIFEQQPISKMDLLLVDQNNLYKNNKGYWYLTDYERIE